MPNLDKLPGIWHNTVQDGPKVKMTKASHESNLDNLNYSEQ